MFCRSGLRQIYVLYKTMYEMYTINIFSAHTPYVSFMHWSLFYLCITSDIYEWNASVMCWIILIAHSRWAICCQWFSLERIHFVCWDVWVNVHFVKHSFLIWFMRCFNNSPLFDFAGQISIHDQLFWVISNPHQVNGKFGAHTSEALIYCQCMHYSALVLLSVVSVCKCKSKCICFCMVWSMHVCGVLCGCM